MTTQTATFCLPGYFSTAQVQRLTAVVRGLLVGEFCACTAVLCINLLRAGGCPILLLNTLPSDAGLGRKTKVARVCRCTCLDN